MSMERKEISYIAFRTVVLFILVVFLLVVLGEVSGVGGTAGSTNAFLPLVFNTFPKPSPVPTPVPVPTPTPIPGVGSWVFVGYAYNYGDITKLYGVKASHCATVEDMKVNKTAWIRSELVPFDECDRGGYNPEAPWPPPVFDPPVSLPPEFAYGDVFGLELPYNVKQVCSVYYGESNCIDVR